MGWFVSMMWWTALRASSADACDGRGDLDDGQQLAPGIENNQNNLCKGVGHHKTDGIDGMVSFGAIRTSRDGHVGGHARRSQQSTFEETRAREHLSFSEQQM